MDGDQTGFLAQRLINLVEQRRFADTTLSQQAYAARFVGASQRGQDLMQDRLPPEEDRRIAGQGGTGRVRVLARLNPGEPLLLAQQAGVVLASELGFEVSGGGDMSLSPG